MCHTSEVEDEYDFLFECKALIEIRKHIAEELAKVLSTESGYCTKQRKTLESVNIHIFTKIVILY